MRRTPTAARTIGTWLLAGMPALVCVLTHGRIMLDFRYPTFDSSMLDTYLVLMLVSLAPVLVWVLCWLFWFRKNREGCFQWFLSVICAGWTVVALFAQLMIAFACPIYSETSDPAHYLKLNSWGAGQRSDIFALFPAQPGTASDHADEEREMRYYYRDACCVDHIFEVYAQWTLPADELEAEKQRVEALFASKGHGWTIETIEYGDFTCMLCYVEDAPFAGEVDYYTHLIFACDEATGRVRDIYNEGTDADAYDDVFQPGYLSLDW